MEATVPGDWDLEADVVVVGFGAAGACAALEAAAAGASVLVLDRFGGGGATALSGGVVYAGGGTPQQRAAGVRRLARGDVRLPAHRGRRRGARRHAQAVLRRQRGHAGLAGGPRRAVRGQPVPGQDVLPDQPALPVLLRQRAVRSRRRAARPQGTQDHGPRHLRRPALRPAGRRRPRRRRPGAHPDHRPRAGHRPRRPGHRGGVPTLRGAPGWARLAHRVLHRWSVKPYLYVPKAGRILHRPVAWLERRYGRPLRVGAARGVVVAAGGFVANRPMLRAHAPGQPRRPAAGHARVTTAAASGSASGRRRDRVPGPGLGLALPQPAARPAGRRAGGPRRATGSATSRATAPRSATRSCGAAGGPGCWSTGPRWPRPAARYAARRCGSSGCRPGTCSPCAVRAPTVAALAARAGRVDPDRLEATWPPTTPRRATRRRPTRRASPPTARRAQDQPPFALIDCSIRPRLFYPAPVLTLGGLVVAAESGQVLRPDGGPVDGLYAAGRSAAGLCSAPTSAACPWPTAFSPAAAPATTPRPPAPRTQAAPDHSPAIGRSPNRHSTGTTATMGFDAVPATMYIRVRDAAVARRHRCGPAMPAADALSPGGGHHRVSPHPP